MAQLDKFFAFLAQPGVYELRFSSGARPAFLTERGQRFASSAQPNTEQLLTLLGEVLDPAALEALRLSGAAEAEVLRPGLPPLVGTFRFVDASTLEAAFRPAPAAVEPPAPAPTFGAVEPPAPAAVSGAVARPSASAPIAAAAPGAAPRTARPAPHISVAAPAPHRALDGPKPIDALFRTMVERKASDLHLSAGEKPILRVDGDMARIEEHPALGPQELYDLVDAIMPQRNRDEYAEVHDTDFAYEIPGVSRFRCNVFADRKGPGAVFRVIPTKILTAEQLGLPPAVLDLCKLTKGLVLVTGPTGSGKSTTLTAMIDHCNTIRRDHIITIEDPIEFVHDNRNCLVNQREVATHTESFKRALRAALREDPDIVLVGEMRDLETIAIAIETAETGHLVFGTLHTTTAVSTVDRIIDQFPPDQQAQVRTMLAEALRGVIAQVLCKKVGGGRVAAMEILLGIPSISNLIREGKTFQVPSIMQTGKKYGMVTLNDALVDLARRGAITAEEAQIRAVDKASIVAALRSMQGA